MITVPVMKELRKEEIIDFIIIIIYLFKVVDIAKILRAQKMYIKLSNTRI